MDYHHKHSEQNTVERWARSEGYMYCDECDENENGCGWIDFDDNIVDIYSLYSRSHFVMVVETINGLQTTTYKSPDSTVLEFNWDLLARSYEDLLHTSKNVDLSILPNEISDRIINKINFLKSEFKC